MICSGIASPNKGDDAQEESAQVQIEACLIIFFGIIEFIHALIKNLQVKKNPSININAIPFVFLMGLLGKKLIDFIKVNRKEIGKKGESMALKCLESKGYNLVASNYRKGRGEIDLIMRQGDLLVFVEVKRRKNADFGYPEETISEAQMDRIMTAAEEFVMENGHTGDIRFDIVAILPGQVLHIEDAFG